LPLPYINGKNSRLNLKKCKKALAIGKKLLYTFKAGVRSRKVAGFGRRVIFAMYSRSHMLESINGGVGAMAE
jgi:hypothetical protein